MGLAEPPRHQVETPAALAQCHSLWVFLLFCATRSRQWFVPPHEWNGSDPARHSTRHGSHVIERSHTLIRINLLAFTKFFQTFTQIA